MGNRWKVLLILPLEKPYIALLIGPSKRCRDTQVAALAAMQELSCNSATRKLGFEGEQEATALFEAMMSHWLGTV